MTSETLSDKIWNPQGIQYIRVKDVKEFIKRLKEDFLEDWANANGKTFTLNEIREKIDKIFGDKLI